MAKEHQAHWIWKDGDYELFHYNMIHTRREECGTFYPPMWNLPTITSNVLFLKRVTLKEPSRFRVFANGEGHVRIGNSVQFGTFGKELLCPAGENIPILIAVVNLRGLPAIYVEGEEIFSDGSWQTLTPHRTSTTRATIQGAPVGHLPMYLSHTDCVESFPFSYERIAPISVQAHANGWLYDFGKELFGHLELKGYGERCSVYYGESREEALDQKDTIIFEHVTKRDACKLRQRAFRYVYVVADRQPTEAIALYEFIPLADVGSFSCDNPDVEKIYALCSHTLHLNTRECFLDGIKRDRWVWSGDAYQSYMIADYLFDAKAVSERTMLGILGHPPYEQHVNTINDYSLYLIIAFYEHWLRYGDRSFVVRFYNRVRALYDFCVSRLDSDGWVCAMPCDWVFIDWANSLDKDGPICAEQILLWQASKSMRALARIAEKDETGIVDENALKDRIYQFYYKKELGGFIDSFASGKNTINRHQNIFAILYDFVTEQEAKQILDKVLLNDDIPHITTPYFEFFELTAFCKMGHVEIAQSWLESYWGGILKEGATSIWEQYDPAESGVQHLAMYKKPYGKSLCHAWGSGPIYLLGRYVAGVESTAVGGATYSVRPNLGSYKSISATVPMSGGSVQVQCENGKVTVLADIDGGTLYTSNGEYPIKKNIPITVAL